MAEGTKKQSQGDECSFFGCSNRVYDATLKNKHALDFHISKELKASSNLGKPCGEKVGERRFPYNQGNCGFEQMTHYEGISNDKIQ